MLLANRPPGSVTSTSFLNAHGPTAGYTSAPMLQDTANVNGTAGSTGGYSHNPHAAMADETISLDSPSHSIGASRAALAGSSFADSEISADHQAVGFQGVDATDSPQGYKGVLGNSSGLAEAPTALPVTGNGLSGYGVSSRAAASEATPPVTGNCLSGVRLSTKPILGGEGTFTVQPVTNSQHQSAPATAASGSRQGESQGDQVADRHTMEAGQSTLGTEAGERGRNGLPAYPELQEERSLRSTYSAGSVCSRLSMS